MSELNLDELMFFEQNQSALPLYVHFRNAILQQIDSVEIQVKKTQISFQRRHLFAAVSFAPVRKAAVRPNSYITVTFGLSRKLDSPRINAAVEPYPNRWTHHVMVGALHEIDGELLSWIKEAAEFSSMKR